MQKSFGTLLSLTLAMAGAALLTACATPPPSVPPAASGTSADAPVTPKVNRLVMALPTPGEGNNVGRDVGTPDNFQLRPMYEYLVGVDAKTGKFYPQLATDWKLEPDGRSWRFQLRKGIPFQGTWGEFTAKDFEFAVWNIAQTDSTNGNSALFRNTVTIEVVNDYELVFHEKERDADIFNLASELVGGVDVKSKAHFDALGGKVNMTTPPPAGTGPYQFKERQQGAFVRFERMPGKHWRATADFPEFEFRWQKEASTRLASLLTGEVQMTPLPKDLQQQALNQGMKLARGSVPAQRIFLSFQGVYVNDVTDPSKGYKYPNSPLMDVRVRQALSKAINRDELNKALFGGKAETMVLDDFHPNWEGWDPTWQQRFPEAYGYDLARARQLLQDAGYGPAKPLKTTMLMTALSQVPESADVQEAIAGMWRSAGVDVQLNNLDTTEATRQSRAMAFDNQLTLTATAAHQILGYRIYGLYILGNLRGNNVEVPEIGDAWLKVRDELDFSKHPPLLKAMGEVAFRNFNHVPLFWLPTETLYNPTFVAGYEFPGNISSLWTHVYNIKAAG